MSNNAVKEIAKLVPDGLSEEGMGEISSILEAYIEDKVSSEVSDVESKVASLFRTKVDSLKELALNELVNEDSNVKAITYFDKIMGIVAEYVETEMIDSKLTEKDKVIATQQKNIETLEGQLNELVNENKRLSQSVEMLQEEHSELNEKLITTKGELTDKEDLMKEAFESSEQAIVIANEHIDDPLASNDNPYLSKEVITLTEQVLSN